MKTRVSLKYFVTDCSNAQISSQQKNGTPEFWETMLLQKIGFYINHEIIFNFIKVAKQKFWERLIFSDS